MKVGIVTLSGGENYGNVLQNYAVQQVLEELGCNVETIKNTTRFGKFYRKEEVNKFTLSYIKKYILNQLNYRYNIKNSGSGIVKTILYCKKNRTALNSAKKARTNVFNEFCNNIHWCSQTIDINKAWNKEQIENFDFFVSGSDQVWNPTSPSVSSINFLQFAPKYKRITFSPSFGVNKIPEQLKADYSKWLSEIPFLSVREEQGEKIVKELCGKEAKVLCDPTMCLTKEQWLNIAKKPEFEIQGKYILTYFLSDKTKAYDKFIKRIASEFGFKIINLFDVLYPQYYNVGPSEFIYLINNADLVCTDSFHGTVFSILMNTNFVAFSRVEDGNSMESRILTLLKTFKLENRNYNNVDKEKLFSTDFSNIENILTQKRNETFEFLKNALESKPVKVDVSEQISVLRDTDLCCGCGTCATVCPKNCLELVTDSEGFKYPEIDRTLCVGCKLCEEVCPVLNNGLPERTVGENSYIAYSLNSEIRKTSSSGGVFTHIAEAVINNGGVVFGAAIIDKKVKHIYAQTIEELEKFKGSKYVQSDIQDSYNAAEKFLKAGRLVLFSGTPCQIKGLYASLKNREYDNLITQDLICHGVPSPLVWEKYVSLKTNSEKADISFRDKTEGWHYFSMLIKDGKKIYRKNLEEDFYLKLFLDNTILRPSCYDCFAKKQGSSADITLADCWKPQTVSNKVKDTDKGLSLVLINSKKGSEFFDKLILNNAVFALEVDSEKAINSQTAINKSAPVNLKRAIFFEALNKCDFTYLINNWYKESPIRSIKHKISYYKMKVKLLIKR